MNDGYHHGDLPNALRAAAVDVIIDKGVGGFSLREVARRAGVSHAAPAHHFGDTTGLLTSLATEAFEKLGDELAAAAEGIDDPLQRLAAIGRAYVAVGIRYPAHCEVVFRHDLLHREDPAYIDAGLRAYGVLEATLRDLADRCNPALDVDDASKLCWATMQGLLVLYPNMSRMSEEAGRPPAPLDELVDRFTRLLLDGLTAR